MKREVRRSGSGAAHVRPEVREVIVRVHVVQREDEVNESLPRARICGAQGTPISLVGSENAVRGAGETAGVDRISTRWPSAPEPGPERRGVLEQFETCPLPRNAPESGPTGEVDMAAGEDAMLVTTCGADGSPGPSV